MSYHPPLRRSPSWRGLLCGACNGPLQSDCAVDPVHGGKGAAETTEKECPTQTQIARDMQNVQSATFVIEKDLIFQIADQNALIEILQGLFPVGVF